MQGRQAGRPAVNGCLGPAPIPCPGTCHKVVPPPGAIPPGVVLLDVVQQQLHVLVQGADVACSRRGAERGPWPCVSLFGRGTRQSPCCPRMEQAAHLNMSTRMMERKTGWPPALHCNVWCARCVSRRAAQPPMPRAPASQSDAVLAAPAAASCPVASQRTSGFSVRTGLVRNWSMNCRPRGGLPAGRERHALRAARADRVQRLFENKFSSGESQDPAATSIIKKC